jgi:hypothetical protein
MRRAVRTPRERLVAGLGVLALVAVVVLAALQPWDRPSGPRITAIFDAVPGLVEGAEVQRAGLTVGRVEEIGLEGDRPRVRLRLDDDEALHRGAVADLRMVSLSGQLNRVVAITDGRGAALPDGATLGLARTEQPVEVEQVLSTLDPATRRAVRRIVRGTERTVDGRGEALAGTLQGLAQALQPHRLEQVVDRAQLEGGQRMVLVGRAEHHLRSRLPGQSRGQRGTVQARHVDVQQQQVRLQLADRRQGRLAVGHATGHHHALAFAQQRGQAGARQRFVVDDQHAHQRGSAGGGSSGRRRRTTKRPSCGPASTAARAP